jgi:superfamily I DNA/RNA helicase
MKLENGSVITLNDFLNNPKGLMIAAAGHGKTYCIAECVKFSNANCCQLVLTHTHAGISSLKKKFSEKCIDTHKYEIQTITGFSQRLVFSFCNKNDIPYSQDNKLFFPWVIKKAAQLLSIKSIQKIIQISYQGLFVDEYQDCDISQHSLVMILANLMPVHIFGDPLQGIFDFNGEKVNFAKDLGQFTQFDLLQKPWRWLINDNNPELGKCILWYRKELYKDKTDFKLVNNRKSGFNVIIPRGGNEIAQLMYISAVVRNIKSESVLVLIPSYYDMSQNRLRGDCNDRAKIKSQLSLYGYTLIEAIDQKDYYSTASKIDETYIKMRRARFKVKKIFNILLQLSFNKSELEDWIDVGNDRVKNRRKEFSKKSECLATMCNTFILNPCSESFLPIIDFFLFEQKTKSKRPGIVYANRKCVANSISNGESVYENMNQYKNKIRMSGRKVLGKCIGTTLLTKGLEFDTVIILWANLIRDKRNFYVAISRACKELYVFSNSYNIHLDP